MRSAFDGKSAVLFNARCNAVCLVEMAREPEGVEEFAVAHCN